MTQQDPDPERDAWAEKIRGGDRKAFGALFRAVYPGLCEYVVRYVASPETAEEVVQETFTQVWERREDLDPNRSLESYLYRSARNRALNHLKHARVHRRSQGRIAAAQSRPPTPEDQLRFTELSTRAQQAIDNLPDRCRRVFLLSREAGLTYGEIAQLLEVSVKTVENQMGRALKGLRAALTPYV